MTTPRISTIIQVAGAHRAAEAIDLGTELYHQTTSGQAQRDVCYCLERAEQNHAITTNHDQQQQEYE